MWWQTPDWATSAALHQKARQRMLSSDSYSSSRATVLVSLLPIKGCVGVRPQRLHCEGDLLLAYGFLRRLRLGSRQSERSQWAFVNSCDLTYCSMFSTFLTNLVSGAFAYTCIDPNTVGCIYEARAGLKSLKRLLLKSSCPSLRIQCQIYSVVTHINKWKEVTQRSKRKHKLSPTNTQRERLHQYQNISMAK